MSRQQPRSTKYGNFICGRETGSETASVFEGTNPTEGASWGIFAQSSPSDVDSAVRGAHAAFLESWGKMSPTERGKRLMLWGAEIARNADHIAAIETTQNGKLFSEMRLQAVLAEEWLRYFGSLADKTEGAVIPLSRQSVLNYTLREPLGVVGVITPWNSPTFLNIMAAAPALAAGNTVVFKPSEVTSASAIEIARLALEAGVPPGVVNVVTGFVDVGEALVQHELVRKISFIGSVPAGRAIGAQTGKRLITSTLELGGKSPNIVFEDADLARAESGVLAGIFAAAGQTCVAGSRAYIQKSIYDRFVARLVDRAKTIKLGNPLEQDTQMGPIATLSQLKKNETMVARAVEAGAELLTGGERATLEQLPNGYFFHPTIIHNAEPSNPAIQEEIFGPVLTVVPFEDENEVIGLANDSEFGLAAGVWTNDFRRAHSMARALQAGTVWINTYRALGFNSPFGGYRNSGTGRNNGIQAIDQYLQTKSVWCELSDEVQDPFVLRA